MFVMRVPMVMPMIVGMTILEQPCGNQVDQQTDDRDRNRMIVADRAGRNQSFDRLEYHQPCNHHQEDCARITAQHLDLPGAERKARVARVFPGEYIRKQRKPQRNRMRAHVPAVRQQRHRVVIPAAGNLDHHHHRGQDGNAQRAFLGKRVSLVKPVGVFQGFCSQWLFHGFVFL